VIGKCQEIPVEKLISYADGELPYEEAEQIAQHISNCEKCRTMLKALQDSLKMVQDIWEGDKEKWGDLHSFKKPKSRRWAFKSIAAVAAGLILICSVSLICLLSQSDEPKKGRVTTLTVSQVELQAEQAAVAAQLLAVGDMYAAQAGGEKYAEERYI
jgi:predicted anti-sigma-YlaC factor YlaD